MDQTEILDRISDGIISVDSAWRCTHVNRRASAILGRSSASLLGTSLWELFGAAAGQPFHEACSRAMTDEESVRITIYHAELDVSLEHHIYPTASGISILFQDVTERRSVEDAALRQREVLEAVAAGRSLATTLATICLSFERGVPGAICAISLVDDDGLRLRKGAAPSLPDAYNEAVEGLLIGPSVGCCGTAAYRREPVFVADMETDPLWERFRDLMRAQRLRACWSAPIFSAQGTLLGTFAIYRRESRLPTERERRQIDDATNLVRLVLERERLHAELAAERSLLAAVLDHLPCAVLIADAPSGRLIRGNPRVERIFGRSIADVRCADLDGPDRAVEGRDGEASPPSEGPLRRALHEGQTVFGEERRHVRADESEGWIRVSAAPIRDGEGRITGAVMTADDISAEKALEAQLQHAQKMEAVGRLAGGIAHDFNNLLTVIRANADFTLEDLPPDHAAVANVKEVLGAADRAAKLTLQLLAFSRKQILNPTLLDLNEVVLTSVELLERLLPPGIALECELAPELGPVRADRGQLQQVLLNLVVNARDAVGARGTIAISTEHETVGPELTWEGEPARPGDYARLAVRDDGSGMDIATSARIFEPFFTTKPVSSGAGLGLSTVYGIVRQSGGWLRVESAIGRGTTISVLLPRVAGSAAIRPEASSAGGSPRGTELVLLVEDEPIVRTSTRRALERSGYRVLEAKHGADALLVWSEHREKIDLVLTDVMMPELSGQELVRQLRAMDPSVRVIFMSGYTGDEAATHGIVDARETLIQKPFSADGLVRSVRAALDAPPRSAQPGDARISRA